MSSDWQQLSNVPCKSYEDAIDSICVLNDTSFAVTDSFTVSIYDQNNNQWTKIYQDKNLYAYEDSDDIGNGLAYNYTTNELYLSRNKTITKINFTDDNTTKIQKNNTNLRLNHCHIIFAENNLHLICGDQNNQHSIYNTSTDDYHEHHDFGTKNDVGYAYYWGGLVHVKSDNKMLLFGGYQKYIRSCTNTIYQCSFNDDSKKWEGWQELYLDKLPFKSQVFGYVLTPDESTIILFGGWNEDIQSNSDLIYIWDLHKMAFTKCAVRCPKRGQYRACILMDNVRDIVIHGYLRQDMNEDGNFYVPRDIIKFIQLWCDRSFVHLIDRLYGHHWKIQLSKLL